jgi:D-alanyl-D-alanine carboxypeptidase
MIKKIFKLTLSGFLFVNSWAYAQSIETKVQAVIDSVYTSNPTSVGIMVSIHSPERGISLSLSSGYSNLDDKTELDPDQPALVASVTKLYVSAAILRLVENGELSTNQPIKNLLTRKTRNLFEEGGYNLDSIQVKHLLSHTSGIENYGNQSYIDFINENKNYRWTRDEQLALTIKVGPPLGKPESVFSYSDANYLLLTEIMERITGNPFYTAMRTLLHYQLSGIDNTWFPTLEEKPKGTKPLVYQYWGKRNWDSYEIDISVDLYGGGGIASTTQDLTSFAYKLFNNEIIKDPEVLNLIFTEVPVKDAEPTHYYFGLSQYEHNGFIAYGHGGFWGTRVLYFPDLKTSIAVYVLEKDEGRLITALIEDILELIIE